METMPAFIEVPSALSGPSCADCPYSLKDEAGGYTYCRRYPPEARDVPVPISAIPMSQQIALPKEAIQRGFVMTKQSGFPLVAPGMLCGEHPDFPDTH